MKKKIFSVTVLVLLSLNTITLFGDPYGCCLCQGSGLPAVPEGGTPFDGNNCLSGCQIITPYEDINGKCPNPNDSRYNLALLKK